MPTVIDSLVVSLGLDAKNFTQGQAETVASVKKTADQVKQATKDVDDVERKSGEARESRAKSAQEGYAKVRNEVLALTAALVGAAGIEQFIQKITASDAAAGRLAGKLDIGVSTLNQWEEAAKRAGGTAEGMDASLSTLSDGMQELALTGHSALVPLFNALDQIPGAIQISTTDAAGKLRPVTDVMKDIGTDIALLAKTDPAKANSLLKMFGFDQGTNTFLLQTNESMASILAHVGQLGLIQPADVTAAQNLNNAWHDLSQVVTDVGRKVTTILSPILTKLMKELADFIVAHKQDIIDIAQRFADWLDKIDWQAVGTGLHHIGEEIGWIIDKLGGLQTIAEAILALFVVKWAAGIGGAIAQILGALRLIPGAAPLLAEAAPLLATPAGIAVAGGALLLGAAAVTAWGLRQTFDPHPDADTAHNAPSANLGNRGHDPNTPSRPGGRGRNAGPDQSAAAQEAYQYFIGQGWTPAQAAGLVGNISAESGFNAKAVGDSGHAYGIGQWHEDRQAQFQAQFGHSIQQSTRAEQLAFMQWELTHTERAAGDALRKAKTAYQAGGVVSKKFERPAATDAQADARGNRAEDFYAQLNAPLSPGPRALPPIDPGLQFGAGATAGVAANSNTANTNTNQVNVANVNVQTQATDAPGIAQGIAPAMQKYSFATQFNKGLQ